MHNRNGETVGDKSNTRGDGDDKGLVRIGLEVHAPCHCLVYKMKLPSCLSALCQSFYSYLVSDWHHQT